MLPFSCFFFSSLLKQLLQPELLSLGVIFFVVIFFFFLLALNISNFIVSLEIAIYFPMLLLSAFISLLFESVVPLLVSLFSPETFLIFFPFSVLAPVSSIVFQPFSPHFQPFTFIFHYLLSLKPPPHRHKGLCKAACQPGEEQRATGRRQSLSTAPALPCALLPSLPTSAPEARLFSESKYTEGFAVVAWPGSVGGSCKILTNLVFQLDQPELLL